MYTVWVKYIVRAVHAESFFMHTWSMAGVALSVIIVYIAHICVSYLNHCVCMAIQYCRVSSLPFQLFGESATTHFTTAVCNCGSNRTIVVLSASRSGSFNVLEVNSFLLFLLCSAHTYIVCVWQNYSVIKCFWWLLSIKKPSTCVSLKWLSHLSVILKVLT